MATPHHVASQAATDSVPPPTTLGDTIIEARDKIPYEFPLIIRANTAGLPFGIAPGETQGRQLRMFDGREGFFYDLGIGNDNRLFITAQGNNLQEQVPPHALEIWSNGSINALVSLSVGTGATPPTFTPAQTGGLHLSSSLVVQGALSVAGAVALTSIAVSSGASLSGGVTLSGTVNVANLPSAPTGATAVMIDANGNLCKAS